MTVVTSDKRIPKSINFSAFIFAFLSIYFKHCFAQKDGNVSACIKVSNQFVNTRFLITAILCTFNVLCFQTLNDQGSSQIALISNLVPTESKYHIHVCACVKAYEYKTSTL